MNKLFTVLCFFLIASSTLFGQTKSTKRGIAFGHHSEADMAAVSKGLSWWYNWYHQPEADVADVYQNYQMDYVPMTWDKNFNETALRSFLDTHPNVKYLLGFNEPNFKVQANMKPSEAAALWPKLEAIAQKYGLKLVSPAVNYCDGCVEENGVTFTDPIKYLDAFFAACPNCQVDYIAIHNYMCYSGALTSYVNSFKKYGKPIWLTEFACWDQATITLNMQKGLVIGALDFLENDPMVFRYSWFTGGRDNKSPYIDLFEAESGKLTELGELYVNYNATHDASLYTTVPARIEAENYSTMSGISLEATSDVDGIANVGYIDAGDWLEYNIDVEETADYKVTLRLASNANTTIELQESGDVLKTLQVPSSGGWQNWQTLETKINFTKGNHKLRVHSVGGNFNINWLQIASNVVVITGTSEPTNASYQVYPNPVNDQLRIELNANNQEKSVWIVDAVGKTLQSRTFKVGEKVEMDFSAYKPGLYMVLVKTANATFTRKVTKL